MYTADFSGAWAKIGRAEEHVEALNAGISEEFSIDEHRPRIGVKFDVETSEYILFINRVPYLDGFYQGVSLLLGDAVNNLRASLDHLAFQLALKHTDGKIRNERSVQFPIDDDPARFSSSAQKWLSEISVEDRAIIERFQPYHPLNSYDSMPGVFLLEPFRPLAALRDLSDMDKHRLLLTVIVPHRDYIVLGGSGGLPHKIMWAHEAKRVGPNYFREEIKPIDFGTELARAIVPDEPPNRQMDVAGYILPEVVLPEGWPVLAALDGVWSMVVKVLREFDPSR